MRKPSLIACLLMTLLLGAQAQRPNVVLIISDDLNTRIGPYMEIDKHTPSLDRLASEGIRFTRAYCQYPLCGPSRASLMSGLHPETNGILRNNDQPGSYRAANPRLSDHPSMAGFFREQGYFTARVSKIYHMGVPGGIEQGAPGGDDPDSWDYAYNVMAPETNSPGTLELLSPGNLHYGSNFARMILKNGTEQTQADYLATSQAIAILESRAAELPPGAKNKVKLKADAPFFLAIGLVRPHVPFIAPENCFAPYPEEEVELPKVKVGKNVPPPALRRQNMKIWKMDEQQKKQTIAAYMASVRFMDQQVGRVLDALERLELRENTIVVFLSDHGYNLGEHDCWSKVSLWEGSVRVPMIISYQGNRELHGSRCETISELIDLYPTLSDLCDLSDKQPSILQGRSLAPLIRDGRPLEPGHMAYTITYGGKGKSLRSKDWRYTRWIENDSIIHEELYHHPSDPEEHKNLSGKRGKQDVLEEMRVIMDRIRKNASQKLAHQ